MAKENKGKKKKKGGFGSWMYRIVMVVLLCIIGFSGYKVYTIWDEYHQGTVAYDDLADIAGASGAPTKPNKKADEKPARLEIKWDALQEQGPGVKGWLRSVGTSINYPVVQGSDNEYYLSHIMTGEYSRKGSLFIDYRLNWPFSEFLTIVYGHRMMDDSMFNSLGNYFEKKGYYEKHAVMELYTPEGDFDLQIFGAANVNAKDQDIYSFDLLDETSQQAYIDWILANNELLGYKDTVEVKPGDRIVMLSTCTYDPGDDRIVVWGKMVPVEKDPKDGAKDESKDDSKDESKNG